MAILVLIKQKAALLTTLLAGHHRGMSNSPSQMALSDYVSAQIATECQELVTQVLVTAQQLSKAGSLEERISLEADLAALIEEVAARVYRAGAEAGAKPFGEILAAS